LFSKHFGGKVERVITNHNKWKDAYKLELTYQKANNLLSKIGEYLILKKDQYKLILDFYKLQNSYNSAYLRWNNTFKKDITKQKKIIYNKIIELNKKNNYHKINLKEKGKNKKCTNKEIAYLAGYIDGDGSISIRSYSKNKPFVPTISFYVSKKKIYLFLLDKLEFSKVREKKGKNKFDNTIIEMKLDYTRANNLNYLINKYLIIKKEQSNLLMKLENIKSQYNNSQIRWDENKKKIKNESLYKIKSKCIELNKRGKSA